MAVNLDHLNNHGHDHFGPIHRDPNCEDCQVAPFIADIQSAWNDRSLPASVRVAIWAETDAYGEKGFVPPQGHDWSGIRDSSPDAIRAMREIAVEALFTGLT